jgi:hypothetical protein
MIQFNLLPDIKKDYIRAKRTKRIVGAIATITVAGSLGLTGLLFSVVQFGQKTHMNNLTVDIDKKEQDIKSIGEIDKILTVQNQLNSLQAIHETKPETSRLFDFFTQLTPAEAAITSASIDFATSTMKITGGANTLSTVNQYVDTLKFVKYTTPESSETETVVFSSVVTDMNRSKDKITYNITAVFDPTIFMNTKTVILRVPNTVTTRSVLNSPDVNSNGLFNAAQPTGGAQ